METKAKKSTQEERLDYLVEEFKADSDEYKKLQTPNSTEDKRRILRSLMNIRMPKELSSEVMKVQDEYLTERAAEKGVVNLSDIPVIREGLSIWQDEKYRALQGTYPVIFLSFAEIKESDYQSAKNKIYQLITDLYEKNTFLLEDRDISEENRRFPRIGRRKDFCYEI